MSTKNKKKNEIESEINLLTRIRISLFYDPIARKIMDEYDLEYKILMGIPILLDSEIVGDANARAIEGVMYLNEDLQDMSFDIVMKYVIHELVHICQHISKDILDNDKEDHYLDRGDEIEAFQKQMLYESKNNSIENVVEYAKNLIEFHEVPKKERVKKIIELLRDMIDDKYKYNISS